MLKRFALVFVALVACAIAQQQQQQYSQQQQFRQPNLQGNFQGDEDHVPIYQWSDWLLQALNSDPQAAMSFFSDDSKIVYTSVLPHGGVYKGIGEIYEWILKMKTSIDIQNFQAQLAGVDPSHASSIYNLRWSGMYKEPQGQLQIEAMQPMQSGRQQRISGQQQQSLPVQQQQQERTVTQQSIPMQQQRTVQQTTVAQPQAQAPLQPAQPVNTIQRRLLQALQSPAQPLQPAAAQPLPQSQAQALPQGYAAQQLPQQQNVQQNQQPQQQQQRSRQSRGAQGGQTFEMESVLIITWRLYDGSIDTMRLYDLNNNQAIQSGPKSLFYLSQFATKWAKTSSLLQNSPVMNLIGDSAVLNLNVFPSDLFTQTQFTGKDGFFDFFRQSNAWLKSEWCAKELPQDMLQFSQQQLPAAQQQQRSPAGRSTLQAPVQPAQAAQPQAIPARTQASGANDFTSGIVRQISSQGCNLIVNLVKGVTASLIDMDILYADDNTVMYELGSKLKKEEGNNFLKEKHTALVTKTFGDNGEIQRVDMTVAPAALLPQLFFSGPVINDDLIYGQQEQRGVSQPQAVQQQNVQQQRTTTVAPSQQNLAQPVAQPEPVQPAQAATTATVQQPQVIEQQRTVQAAQPAVSETTVQQPAPVTV